MLRISTVRMYGERVSKGKGIQGIEAVESLRCAVSFSKVP